MTHYEKILIKLLIAQVILSLICFRSSGQIEINGPNCVIGGVNYQYNISCSRDSIPAFQICITGGKLAESGTTCKNIADVPQVKVKWDENNTTGTITIESTDGNISKAVRITSLLNGGSINSTGRIQAINKDVIPPPIICSKASGGSCSPVYEYQWQRSLDNMEWTDMAEEKSKNLNFTSPIFTVTYFRRKVMEKNSNSVAYSNIAVVLVLNQDQ